VALSPNLSRELARYFLTERGKYEDSVDNPEQTGFGAPRDRR